MRTHAAIEGHLSVSQTTLSSYLNNILRYASLMMKKCSKSKNYFVSSNNSAHNSRTISLSCSLSVSSTSSKIVIYYNFLIAEAFIAAFSYSLCDYPFSIPGNATNGYSTPSISCVSSSDVPVPYSDPT